MLTFVMRFPVIISCSFFSVFLGLQPALYAAAPATSSKPASAAPPTNFEWSDDDAENACDIAFNLKKGTTGNFTLAFDYQGPADFYTLESDAKGVRFTQTKAGQRTVLSSSPFIMGAKTPLVIQRRPWVMQLLANGRPVLRAFDATWNSGKIGIARSGGWQEDDIRVQPVEAIRFDDDFTRAGEGGDNSWTVGHGKWDLTAASTHINARTVDMSANPFAYVSQKGDGIAFASTGRWFWDSYDARVAVRPADTGDVGIAAYVQDPQTYLAFRWSSQAGPQARRLVAVRDGKETVLASAPGNFVPRQWSQIGIRTSPGYVEALLDGVPVLRAPNTMLGQGGVALLNRGGAIFDDVKIRSYDFLRADFAGSGAWTQRGKWNLTTGAATPAIANSILTTGKNDWDAYRALISLQLAPNGAAGFIVGWADPKNYSVMRLANAAASVPYKGRVQVVNIKNGVSKVVSDVPLPPMAGLKRLQIEAQNGSFDASTGGQSIVSAILPSTRGQFGLLGANTGATYKDAVIFFPQPVEPVKVAERFENDGFMVGWANSAGQWPPTPGPQGLEFWNTSELFGDWDLNFPWRDNWHGKMEITALAQRGNFDSGFVLRGEGGGTEPVTWTLLDGGKTLATAKSSMADIASGDDGAKLHLLRENQRLVLLGGDKAILSAPLSRIPGTALAVRTNGFRIRSDRLDLQNTNRDDFTFSDAPTDLYTSSGSWSVFSRWPCYGDWSFFGGTGRNPALWTKHTYGGDQVVEFYAHPQMDMPKEPGYSHPGDLNVTLCGDGMSPASGYAFVIAGHDNTRSQILKNGQVVADNSSDAAWFHDTINHNMSWHRKWFYIRAEARSTMRDGKRGVLLALTVDNDPIAEYFDPSPLPLWQKGGRVAFWTLDSTMMLARAKIEAQTFGGKSVPTVLVDTVPAAAPSLPALAPRPVVENDAETALVKNADGIWKVSNPVSGGLFAVDLSAAPLQVKLGDKLSFDTKMNGAKVDAYVFVNNQWLTLPLTGGQKKDAMAPDIAAVPSAGTDGWMKADYDLGAALKKQFPNEKNWTVEKIRIGALQGDAYRWQGFDGNSVGSSYELRNLKWVS